MRAKKIKVAKSSVFFRSRDFTRFETAFAFNMIKSTPVTPERLAVAECKASRSRDARSAKFLDAYRAKLAA
jgi:hypothetical protein